jgi:beta-lactamase regulating signal transducer with metallopeptidase domain
VVVASLPAPTPDASVNPLQVIIFMLTVIWILGAAAFLLYSILTYRMLKQRTDAAVLAEGNVYECEGIDTPCVIELIHPKIYLPYGLSPSERSYILKHEQTHITRFDYLIKPLAFLALCLHWFNPLVWFGFLLMGRDMEMSCDESVLKSMGPDIKRITATPSCPLRQEGASSAAAPWPSARGIQKTGSATFLITGAFLCGSP